MSTEEVDRAAARRAKREQAQKSAEVTAKAESLIQAKPAPKADVVRREAQRKHVEEPIAKAEVHVNRGKTKRLAKAAQQAAARKQSIEDALRQPTPAVDLTPPGETPPLHILRQRAKQIDAEMRDTARSVGKEVGELAEELINGRMPRDRHTRRRRQAEAEARAGLLRRNAAKSE